MTARLRPIRIEPGALGNGLPRRALVVSPQHRISVKSGALAKLYGGREALVAAKHLVGLPGITEVKAREMRMLGGRPDGARGGAATAGPGAPARGLTVLGAPFCSQGDQQSAD